MVKSWQKYIEKLSNNEKIVFRDTIQKLILRDFSSLDTTKIAGTKNTYRCRVGSKRVIFSIIDGKTTIEKIGPRGDVYK